MEIVYIAIPQVLASIYHRRSPKLVTFLDHRSAMAKQKRSRSVFDAVQQLDQEDSKAEGERQTASKRDIQKSKAAQSQTKIYSSLVECRILLQRAITSAKKPKLENKSEAVQQCDDLLEHLLLARQKLLQKQDEEVSTEPEKLQSDYETCREEWKHVLNRRHRSVQLHAPTKFGGIDSFWQQVESTVQHEQLRRKDDDEFDDTKIYQHMLKDFVASNQSEAETAAQQRLRSKKSKKDHPDRRASKGRKIRYTPVPKLANFCFPQSRPVSNTLDEDEWFRSLFGGAGSMPTTSS